MASDTINPDGIPVFPVFPILGLFWESGLCQFGHSSFGLTDLDRSPGYDHRPPLAVTLPAPIKSLK